MGHYDTYGSTYYSIRVGPVRTGSPGRHRTTPEDKRSRRLQCSVRKRVYCIASGYSGWSATSPDAATWGYHNPAFSYSHPSLRSCFWGRYVRCRRSAEQLHNQHDPQRRRITWAQVSQAQAVTGVGRRYATATVTLSRLARTLPIQGC